MTDENKRTRSAAMQAAAEQAGRLGRVESLVDAEIKRLDTKDIHAEWWQWRRRHWVDGVGTARAVSLRQMWAIKSVLLERQAAGQ